MGRGGAFCHQRSPRGGTIVTVKLNNISKTDCLPQAQGGPPIHYLYGYVPPNGIVILKLLGNNLAQNVFRGWTVSSIFSLLWLILFSGRIYSENVNWCWSLLTVQKLFLVITDWKQTHRRTFQVFQYYTKLQLKSKLPVGKNVKALSAFLNVPAVRKIQESWLKGSFRKAEKATVSIMFG